MPQPKSSVASLSDQELDDLIKKKSKPVHELSDEELDTAIAAKSPKKEIGFDPEAIKVGVEKGATFGARPFIAGVAGGAGYGLDQAVRKGSGLVDTVKKGYEGFKTGFSGARKEAQDQQEMLANRSPLQSLAGEVGGGFLVPGGIIKGIKAGATGIRGAGRVGIALGAGSALGEANTQQEAMDSISMGGALGAGGEVLANKLGQGASAIERQFRKESAQNTLKAAGFINKDFKKIFARDRNGEKRITDLADAAQQEGMVSVGSTVEDVKRKASEKVDKYGKQIGAVFKQVDELLSNPETLSQLTPDQIGVLNKSHLNPIQMADEIGRELAEGAKGVAGGPQALSRAQKELEVLASLGQSADASDLVKFRRSVDDLINFDQSVKDQPLYQKQLKAIRNSINERIQKRIGAVDEIFGGELGATLKNSNKGYSMAIELEKKAGEGVARDVGNKSFGLRQAILVGGGAAAGGAAGGDIDSVAKGAAAGYSLKILERYGPAILAKAERAAADQIQKSAVLRKLVDKNPVAYQNLLQSIAEKVGGQ